jgi:hypothetical protein
MARLTCRACGSDSLLRARCFTPVEYIAGLLLVSPFRCQSCGHRFLEFRIGRDYPRRLVDRRMHKRFPVHFALSFSGGKLTGKGTVTDISMGGCTVVGYATVQIDDIFYLKLHILEDRPPVEVAATVRWVSPKGIGFQFLRSARENQRLLEFLKSQGA